MTLLWKRARMIAKFYHKPKPIMTKNSDPKELERGLEQAHLTQRRIARRQIVNRRSNLTPYRRPILTPLSDVYGR